MKIRENFKIIEINGQDVKIYNDVFLLLKLLQKSLKKSECSICLSDNCKNLLQTSCNHTFHNRCLSKWIKNNINCPYCNSLLFDPKIFS